MTIQKQKNLRKQVAPFEKAVMKDSIRQLINTFLPFFTLWFLAYESLSISYFLAFPLIVIAAGFLVRIFIIFITMLIIIFEKTANNFLKNNDNDLSS